MSLTSGLPRSGPSSPPLITPGANPTNDGRWRNRQRCISYVPTLLLKREFLHPFNSEFGAPMRVRLFVLDVVFKRYRSVTVSAVLDWGFFSSVCAESLQKVARNEAK